MSVLVLRHEPFEHLGYFTQALTVPFRYHDPGEDFASESFQAWIILGGPMSANDAEMAAELAMIERALREGVPLLGICLGSQLIAEALGARVYRNSALEIGWEPVFFTDSARADPVFGEIPSPSTFFHWHGETFDLPRGAEWLAWSEKTRHQAYRYSSNVYGVQFHPEVTPEMIEDWCSQPVNCADVATLSTRIDPHAHDQSQFATEILRRWLLTADC
jgi:GMP synthase (glutamine-hydrolysing)